MKTQTVLFIFCLSILFCLGILSLVLEHQNKRHVVIEVNSDQLISDLPKKPYDLGEANIPFKDTYITSSNIIVSSADKVIGIETITNNFSSDVTIKQVASALVDGIIIVSAYKFLGVGTNAPAEKMNVSVNTKQEI